MHTLVSLHFARMLKGSEVEIPGMEGKDCKKERERQGARWPAVSRIALLEQHAHSGMQVNGAGTFALQQRSTGVQLHEIFDWTHHALTCGVGNRSSAQDYITCWLSPPSKPPLKGKEGAVREVLLFVLGLRRPSVAGYRACNYIAPVTFDGDRAADTK